MKTTEIVVEVSTEQARLFAVLAKKIEAAPGDIMLALACDRLMANPGSALEFPDTELAALCWNYIRSREVPEADQWLDAEEMKALGFEARAAEVCRV